MFPELPGLILYIYHPHCMYYSQELLVPIWPGLALYIHSWDFGAALPQLSHLQCTPKVLVPNSSMSSVGQPSPALSMPTSFGVAKEDVGNPSQDQKLSIVKLDLTQSRHSKAVLRKELKKDVQMNAVFKEICVDFYLLSITENLFIENSTHFKPVIRQLQHETFTSLCVTPFDHPANSVALSSVFYSISLS